MSIGTVAAINRKSSLVAIRCDNGTYTLTNIPDSWRPLLGEAVEGEFARLGSQQMMVGDGASALLDVQSFNCSHNFARDRLVA